jgi:SAM-dependent methyltransferase
MDRTDECRSCFGTGLVDVLSLGCLPLANALLTTEQLAEPEETYPLNLVFCPHCTLVQITETVPPEKLFRDYVYLSSFSDTILRHAQELAGRMAVSQRLNAASLVVEVASNDGYLLQYYKQAGIPVLGIEPAANIARIAEEKRGIPTLCEFFGEKVAMQLRQEGRAADVIHAHNVLAHVPNLNGVVRGFKILLKETGLAILEVPYVRDMVNQCAFDTAYHEHLCYFSLTALDRLFTRHGLIIRDVEQLNIHGGTLRLYVTHENRTADGSSDIVTQMLAEETNKGMGDPAFYLGFGARIAALRDRLVTLLHDLKSQGSRIAVYGASAKGSTLLNYFQIGRETLDYVVDRSTLKQGLYTPGTRLPIYPPDKILRDLPDYVLLLAWNLAAEILEQQAEYRRQGGKFIIPVPEPRII